VSASVTAPAPGASSTRRRSAASTWRTTSTMRRRGICRSASCPSTRTNSTSTEGNARSAACTATLFRLSSCGKQRLHSLLHPCDPLVGFPTDCRSVSTGGGGSQEPTHGLLGQARPQLIEVPGREPLPFQGAAPFARQFLDEAIALECEPAGALDQVGQTRRHAATPSPDSGQYPAGWPPIGWWMRMDRPVRW